MIQQCQDLGGLAAAQIDRHPVRAPTESRHKTHPDLPLAAWLVPDYIQPLVKRQ